MNHPSNEDWMEYLYRELPHSRRRVLEEHLRDCGCCQDSVTRWREVVQSLNAWPLPHHQTAVSAGISRLKWAAAAVLVFALGLWSGIVFMGNPNSLGLMKHAAASDRIHRDALASLGADLTNHLALVRDQLLEIARQENLNLTAQLVTQIQAARQEDLQTMQAACQQLEQKFETDVAWLRHDLETVAVKASDQLYWTRQKLGQLAQASDFSTESPRGGGAME
jgi:hypothetical protein